MLRIYVGNLNYETGNEELKTMFGEFGDVNDAVIIMDRDTGRSRGFGFIEMADETEGRAAIEQLNGKEIEGRTLTVNEARPRSTERR